MRFLLLSFVLMFAAACAPPGVKEEVSAPAAGPDAPAADSRPEFTSDARAVALDAGKNLVAGFFKPMGSPDKNEWLSRFKEAGQTFPEYVVSNPTRMTAERRVIYILPAGDFTSEQRRAVALAGEYMKAFYGADVKSLPAVSLASVPAGRRRNNPSDGTPQVKSGWFLDEFLPPRLPDDGAALICLTTVDLYPEDEWNFVFGQANLQTRVGVYSLARFGNAAGTARERRRFLERTLKVSMHETGHMFSIDHCTKYVCLMSGSLGLMETDAQPVDVCPECGAKIAWAFDYEPEKRYRRLAAFCRKVGWADEAEIFDRKAAAVMKKDTPR